MNKSTKNILTIVGLALAAFLLICGGIYATRNLGKSDAIISEEDALTTLAKYVNKLSVTEGTPTKGSVEYDDTDDDADELPDIDTCEIVVDETTSTYVEIWSSPEKAGSGTDGWLTEMAEAFNEEGYEVDGETVSVRLRQVNSGQAIDYISSGKAVPDGFTPSAMFWVDMLNYDGVDTETITESMVGNVAGIVIANDVYDEFLETYGSVDMMTITQATAEGSFAMGYTNPFASSTGFNFLVNTLLRYDSDNPLSDTAVEGFTAFQSNVPLVSLTTIQMRSAAEKGTLDGFVMEYQTYSTDATLTSNYTFTPFGYRHDNPLVAMESTSDTAKEILQMFADYCASDEAVALADKYGFNGYESYSCEYEDLDGATLYAAQDLYKTNKDTGKSVIAVFVADVSGSMSGDPMN